MVHLGNHPEVALCRSYARWVGRTAAEIEDRDRTGIPVAVRNLVRRLRRAATDRDWHPAPVLGRPLRWLGRYLP